jgi:hypothetical protein
VVFNSQERFDFDRITKPSLTSIRLQTDYYFFTRFLETFQFHNPASAVNGMLLSQQPMIALALGRTDTRRITKQSVCFG